MPETDLHLPVRIGADPRATEGRFYDAADARAGVVMIGGVGGGYDSPAGGLYVRLARHLPGDGIAALRVRLRLPGDLGEARRDVLAGVEWLEGRGIGRVALVGHSFGGAVVIGAGAANHAVAAIVAISTQNGGTEAVSRLTGVPLLLLHGTADEVLPPDASVDVYRRAPRAELRLLEGGDHLLDGHVDEVYRIVHEWLLAALAEDHRPAAP
jgi:dienelactone hydrolase